MTSWMPSLSVFGLVLLCSTSSVSFAEKVCHSIMPGVPDSWCNENCNWTPPNCPETYCQCDSGPAPTPGPGPTPGPAPTPGPVPTPGPAPAPTPPGPPPSKAIIGYWGSAAQLPKKAQLAEALDRGYNVISVAFADHINSDGSFKITTNLGDPPTKEAISADSTKDSSQWQYLLSFGGQNAIGPVLPDGAAEDAFVEGFVQTLDGVVTMYKFDGIDIDIEQGMTTPLLRAFRRVFQKLHAKGLIISMAPQPPNIDPGEVSTFMEGSYNCYVPLVDETIIETVTYVAVQMYNNPMPFRDFEKYIESMQSDNTVQWDGQQLKVNIPSSKLVFGHPAAVGAAPAGPSEPWQNDPAKIVDRYRESPELMQTGGVMTWSIGWDASDGWRFIENVKNIWGQS